MDAITLVVVSYVSVLGQDFFFDPYPNGNYQVFSENAGIFPANERVQGRWNGDPHDLDGGSGYSEMDGGAWLLPYWLARAFNLLTAPHPA